MGEVARKKPFSFHITAAHSPSAHIIKEMELPVPTVDAATLVMNEAFCRFNKSIQDHHSQCSTVSDFKAEILHDTAPAARLNVVLCEIAEGNFRQAMLLAEKELENEPYGLFNTVTWRDKEHIRLCERVLPEKAVSICSRSFGRAGDRREADRHGLRQSGRQGNHHCGIGENE